MFAEALVQIRPIRGLPVWVRYLVTTGLVFACFALRLVLENTDDPLHLPIYLMFVPAVILAAFLFDRGSGFFAVVLSCVVGLYFFIDPRGSLRVWHVGEAIRLVAFLLVGFLCAGLVEALRKTVDDLADRTAQLSQRTNELSEARAELLELSEHRKILLSDLNHRIKNHLAAVSAGIAISSNRVDDPIAKQALDAAVARLHVLASVYRKLHSDGAEAALDSKPFGGLCSDLATSLIGLRPVQVEWNIENHPLNSQQAVNLGLITNELVTNAVKYAFPDDRSGNIFVRYEKDQSGYKLEVVDDGAGPPPTKPDIAGTGTGTKLVKALVGQMGGNVTWHHSPGTRVIVTLPEMSQGDANA
jgi:two-component sensor histidine kinase